MLFSPFFDIKDLYMVFESTGESHVVSNSCVQAWYGISLALMLENARQWNASKKRRHVSTYKHVTNVARKLGFAVALLCTSGNSPAQAPMLYVHEWVHRQITTSFVENCKFHEKACRVLWHSKLLAQPCVLLGKSRRLFMCLLLFALWLFFRLLARQESIICSKWYSKMANTP